MMTWAQLELRHRAVAVPQQQEKKRVSRAPLKGARAAFTGRVTLTPVTLHNGVRCPRAKTTTGASMGSVVLSRGGGRSRRQRVVLKERASSSLPVTGGRHPSQRGQVSTGKDDGGRVDEPQSRQWGGGLGPKPSARWCWRERAESGPRARSVPPACCTPTRTHRCRSSIVNLRSNDVDQSYLTSVAFFEVPT